MSDLFSLNWKDLFNGLIVSVIGAVGTALGTILSSGVLPTLADLKTIGIGALTAGGAYLIKRLVSDTTGTVGGTTKAS